MKIVAIGDTHGQHRKLNMPKGDVLIHVGDIVQGVRSDNRVEVFGDFLKWIESLDYKKKIGIAGNHDLLLAERKDCFGNDVEYLENSGTEFDGYSFWGSPWVTPCYGVFNEEENKLEKMFSQIPDNTDVLITHISPWNIMDLSSSGRNTGSTALLKHTKRSRPTLHLFGHCHNSGHKFSTEDKTTFANVSCMKGRCILPNSPMVFKLNKQGKSR
jgi:Icc-related predicted phosphoesterase